MKRPPATDRGDRTKAREAFRTILEYRRAAAAGGVLSGLKARARRAFWSLGGDPVRSSLSLKDYDHRRHGPFLGVSDEGSATRAILRATRSSPKARALTSRMARSPLALGVALDAERLSGIGEVAVGRDEYADIWLGCVSRLLTTTNIGTRVNFRSYVTEPVVTVRNDDRRSVDEAKEALASYFRPFVRTPDGKPRPLTVFVDIPRYVSLTTSRKRAILSALQEFVSRGRAAGPRFRRAPRGQQLGLAVWIGAGKKGQVDAAEAIALAAACGIRLVLLNGIRRKDAAHLGGNAGLLEYFRPGIVGPLLRDAHARGVAIRSATVPDTETIARSIWVGLKTAQGCGVHLGKYGCFPLTLEEIDRVVGQVQAWFPDWSAAPVFFVDQGLVRRGHIDVGHDLARGIRVWLKTIAKHRVRVVLIDTIDKSTGHGLLKRHAADHKGFLTLAAIQSINSLAARLGIRVLWAGGLTLRDAYVMGALRVFGIYVTTAASTLTPVRASYERDPRLPALKEPTFDGVLRTKTLLEAGFLRSTLSGIVSERVDTLAELVLTSHEAGDQHALVRQLSQLQEACRDGWHQLWRL